MFLRQNLKHVLERISRIDLQKENVHTKTGTAQVSRIKSCYGNDRAKDIAATYWIRAKDTVYIGILAGSGSLYVYLTYKSPEAFN